MDVSERLHCITQRLPSLLSASLNIKCLTNKMQLIKTTLKDKKTDKVSFRPFSALHFSNHLTQARNAAAVPTSPCTTQWTLNSLTLLVKPLKSFASLVLLFCVSLDQSNNNNDDNNDNDDDLVCKGHLNGLKRSLRVQLYNPKNWPDGEFECGSTII